MYVHIWLPHVHTHTCGCVKAQRQHWVFSSTTLHCAVVLFRDRVSPWTWNSPGPVVCLASGLSIPLSPPSQHWITVPHYHAWLLPTESSLTTPVKIIQCCEPTSFLLQSEIQTDLIHLEIRKSFLRKSFLTNQVMSPLSGMISYLSGCRDLLEYSSVV